MTTSKSLEKSKVRNYGDGMSEAVEDYTKAIYALQPRFEGVVPTNALAERMNVAPASATAMVKKMARINLAIHQPYGGVSLTKSGEMVALEVMRHHRLIELYLADTFDMPWDQVHREAEILEHALSEELEELIAEKLGDPTIDPHGDPIPTKDGKLDEIDTVALSELNPGQKGLFARVSDSDPAMLRYLSERNIRPGQKFVVTDKQPFGGPLFVNFDNKEHVIGGELANAMRVTV